jgi:hypothetical protein
MSWPVVFRIFHRSRSALAFRTACNNQGVLGLGPPEKLLKTIFM